VGLLKFDFPPKSIPESVSETETEHDVVATELTLIELSGRLRAVGVLDERSVDKSLTCESLLI
jgi:hypothetical protein